MNETRLWAVVAVAVAFSTFAPAAEREQDAQGAPAKTTLKTERFDRDPAWDGHNNRMRPRREAYTIKQDFGYSATSLAGGKTGEIGGWISPAAEPAFYAMAIPDRTLGDPLTVSGKLYVPKGGGNTLVGFFNKDTLKEWRTPSTLVLRINARGDEGFHLHVEYCTARWRAGGEFIGDVDHRTQKKQQRLLACNTVHPWTLTYDPKAADGRGAVRVTLGREELVMSLDPGHKADGATFNRFGILNVLKSADGGGSLWLDDLNVNGTAPAFDSDPKWEQLDNRRTYQTHNIRPVFDFGFSDTRHAGGAAAGEIGGLLFRGDEREPDRLAYYGDVVGDLSLNDALFASGKVALRRGVTDSTVLFGFFHATDSIRRSDSQKSGIPENFLGVAIEGPSSQGFFFYPVYGLDRDSQAQTGAYAKDPPRIYPDGASHQWTMRYEPDAKGDAKGGGRMTVTLDGKTIQIAVSPEHRAMGGRFNRFGFVTTHIDGNGQEVFLDDLTYTTAGRK
jgi:hypothetical protein